MIYDSYHNRNIAEQLFYVYGNFKDEFAELSLVILHSYLKNYYRTKTIIFIMPQITKRHFILIPNRTKIHNRIAIEERKSLR